MFRAVALIVLTGVLAGCGSMDAAVRGGDESGISAGQFAAARRAAVQLRKLDDSSRAAPERRAELRRSLWSFERTLIRNVVRREQSDDWAGAQALFDRALDAVPDSKILRSAEKQFTERRAVRESVLRAELAVHEGEQLLKDAEAYERLKKVKQPGLLNWVETNAYENRRARSAAELHRYGELALEHNDYYLARRCLSLADRLDGNEVIREGLKQADREIARLRRRVAGSRQPAVGDQPVDVPDAALDVESEVVEFHQALQNGRPGKAQAHLQAIQRAHPGSAEVRRLAARLDVRLRRHLNDAIERGKVLYSEGKVEEALSVWKQVRPLDPDNVELLSSISRAEKVLENLRVLSAQQEDDHSS